MELGMWDIGGFFVLLNCIWGKWFWRKIVVGN